MQCDADILPPIDRLCQRQWRRSFRPYLWKCFHRSISHPPVVRRERCSLALTSFASDGPPWPVALKHSRKSLISRKARWDSARTASSCTFRSRSLTGSLIGSPSLDPERRANHSRENRFRFNPSELSQGTARLRIFRVNAFNYKRPVLLPLWTMRLLGERPERGTAQSTVYFVSSAHSPQLTRKCAASSMQNLNSCRYRTRSLAEAVPCCCKISITLMMPAPAWIGRRTYLQFLTVGSNAHW